jgi:hypothetical protein
MDGESSQQQEQQQQLPTALLSKQQQVQHAQQSSVLKRPREQSLSGPLQGADSAGLGDPFLAAASAAEAADAMEEDAQQQQVRIDARFAETGCVRQCLTLSLMTDNTIVST